MGCCSEKAVTSALLTLVRWETSARARMQHVMGLTGNLHHASVSHCSPLHFCPLSPPYRSSNALSPSPPPAIAPPLPSHVKRPSAPA
ncbi:hypothetical protein BDZ91DRAFT_726892 [Kalaharituber pfeilii]|nr:hypothetical protein BDZ91DRAFT_726835 [Kalaharituber pfeilii]KAF8465727.1 hypothetical protein BDZ91DRAFT_726892 [Kalaharituber pfeilii]